jgi:hypothetical protein
MVCVKGRLGVDCRHNPRGDRHSRDRDNRTDEPDLSETRTRERTVDDIHSGATAGRSRPQRLQLGRKRMCSTVMKRTVRPFPGLADF